MPIKNNKNLDSGGINLQAYIEKKQERNVCVLWSTREWESGEKIGEGVATDAKF
jgi:hypothetical protein